MTPKVPSTDDLRMSSKEFDRIMGQALQVKPENAKTPKRAAKKKAEQTNKEESRG